MITVVVLKALVILFLINTKNGCYILHWVHSWYCVSDWFNPSSHRSQLLNHSIKMEHIYWKLLFLKGIRWIVKGIHKKLSGWNLIFILCRLHVKQKLVLFIIMLASPISIFCCWILENKHKPCPHASQSRSFFQRKFANLRKVFSCKLESRGAIHFTIQIENYLD